MDGDHYKISGAAAADASGVVIRNTSGRNYGIVITSSIPMSTQAGYCSNSATLPTVITQGTGRTGGYNFTTSNQVFGNTVTTTSGFSALYYGNADSSVNPTGAKLYVYAIDCSKLT